MDHSTQFQLVPSNTKRPTGNFVVFEQLPADTQQEFSQWMDESLARLETLNLDLVSPNSARKDLKQGR